MSTDAGSELRGNQQSVVEHSLVEHRSNELSADEREKRRWMLGSTFVNLALALGKLAWGLEVGSHVVLADAVHSASDVFGAFLVYLAVRFAPHRSRRFPDGLFKLEDMAALLGGAGVVFAGWEIIRSVFLAGAESEVRMPLQTLGFMAIVLTVQIIFYRYEDRAAKRLSSPGLGADVVNWLGDIGAGVVVVAGVAGSMLHVPHAQEAAVAVIVLLVFHGAYEVIKGALLSLLDAATAEEETATAKELLEGHARVNHIHDLRLRRAGGALFLQATLIIDAADFETAHDVVDALEGALRERIPRLEGVTLHYEPSHN